jgi:hypothetical protein
MVIDWCFQTKSRLHCWTNPQNDSGLLIVDPLPPIVMSCIQVFIPHTNEYLKHDLLVPSVHHSKMDGQNVYTSFSCFNQVVHTVLQILYELQMSTINVICGTTKGKIARINRNVFLLTFSKYLLCCSSHCMNGLFFFKRKSKHLQSSSYNNS